MKPRKPKHIETNLISLLSKGDRDAFSIIFKTYYQDLVFFAYTYLKEEEVAEEVVQEIFVKLWEKHNTLSINTSLKSYLLKSVQNKCFDWLQHLKVRNAYHKQQLQYPELYQNNTEEYILHSELNDKIENTLNQLSPEIAEAFKMSRFEELKYAEIAQKLNVSVRTVENRVSKALQALRSLLNVFICYFMWFLGLAASLLTTMSKL